MVAGGNRSRRPSSSTARPSPAVTTAAGSTFMAGVPMNVATVRSRGWRKTVRGASTCRTAPRSITASRVDIVIASTWSWVTYTMVDDMAR